MTTLETVEHDERPPIPRPPAEPAVVVEHVVRRFGGRVVLQDISFTVAPSTAFGIAGANGSGKTVLLRLIASLDRPTSGRISIHGYDTMRRARAVRDRIGKPIKYPPSRPEIEIGSRRDHREVRSSIQAGRADRGRDSFQPMGRLGINTFYALKEKISAANTWKRIRGMTLKGSEQATIPAALYSGRSTQWLAWDPEALDKWLDADA